MTRTDADMEKDKVVFEEDLDNLVRENIEFKKDKEVTVTDSDDMDRDNTDKRN